MQPGRRTGRPRGRWIKGTHDSMAERVVEEEQWVDKEEWQLRIGMSVTWSSKQTRELWVFKLDHWAGV
jgi:hypothetical protein